MKKLLSVIITLVLLVLGLNLPATAQAQTGFEITRTSVQVDFPLRLNFSVSAQSSASIVDIRLHYHIQREAFAEVVNEVAMRFAPATQVDITYPLEMVRTGGLPPGTELIYWWTAKDQQGRLVETPPAMVQFDDDRYDWQSIAEGKVTLYWYRGDDAFAQELMASAQAALDLLAADTGAELKTPASIYIYASTEDLQGSLVYAPGEWAGGLAFTGYGVISLGISTNNLAWGNRAIGHELTHLIIDQVTSNPYNFLPVWLNEGLAVYTEGPTDASFLFVLSNAVKNDRLISVRSLSSPFSAYTDQAIQAYAQSASIVAFLIETYGQGKMLELLQTFKAGSTFDDAFLKVYGFDMDGLNQLWLEAVRAQFGVTSYLPDKSLLLAMA